MANDASEYSLIIKMMIEQVQAQNEVNKIAKKLQPVTIDVNLGLQDAKSQIETIKQQIGAGSEKITTKAIFGKTGELEGYNIGVTRIANGLKTVDSYMASIDKNGDWAVKQTKSLDSATNQLSKQEKILKEQNKSRTAALSKLRAEQEAHKSIGQVLTNNMAKVAEWAVSTALIYGTLQEIRKAMEYIVSLNKEMTNIQIVTGMSQSEVGNLASQYNNLAKEMGSTTLQVAKSSLEWFRQGKTIQEANELVKASLMISKLGNMESAQATEYLTSILNGFKLEAKDTAMVIDHLVALDNSYATSVAEIASALQRSSNSAQQAGVSFDELASYITVVSSVTRKSAESIGESFKTMFARMENIKLGKMFEDDATNINDVERALSLVNIKIRDTETSFRPMSDVFDEIAQKWSTMNDLEQSAVANAIAGVRQRENFLTLMANYNQVLEAQTIAAESAGTGIERYGIYLDSIEAKLNKFKATWEGVWSETISDDFVKMLIDAGTASMQLVDNLGGMVPIILAVGAGLLVLKANSILTTITPALTYIPRLINMLILWKQGMLGVGGANIVVAETQALVTGGLSILVGGLVILLSNLDKIIPSMTTFNEKLKENYDITTGNIDELNSLADEYETLANKYYKTSEDTIRLLDIQTILNTKYGYATEGIDVYSAAIDRNSEAIQENIRLIKERSHLEAESFVSENLAEYEKAKAYLSNSRYVVDAFSARSFKGTPEEIAAMLMSNIAKGKVAEESPTLGNLQKQIQASKEIIINYEHYTNVLKVNNEEISNNSEVTKRNTVAHNLNVLANTHSIEEIQKFSEATSEASADIVSTTDNVKSLVLALEDSNAATMEQVEQLRKMFPDNYMEALIFEGNQIKINTQALKELTITKAANAVVTAQSAVTAINSDIETANSAIRAAEAIVKAQNARLQSMGYIGGAYVREAILAINTANAEISAAKAVIDARNQEITSANDNLRIAKQYLSMVQSNTYWTNQLAKSTGGAASATNALADAQKKAYQSEIDGINKRKDALEKQKQALEDQKDAYKEIIDALKEKLRLQKEEKDYQDELANKNEELIDIDNKLIAIQFDNSEEANAKRLKLEEERAKKAEEIAQFQADRTYDIQIEALDAEYAAYEKMIDAQIAGIDRMIERFDLMIEAINRMIDALNELASAGGGGGVLTPLVESTSNFKSVKKVAGNIKSGIARSGTIKAITKHDGGLVETHHDGDFAGGLKSNEVYAKLLKGEYVSTEKQMNDFITRTLPALMGHDASNSYGSVRIGDIHISVAGNLDKVTLNEISDKVFATLNKAIRQRGKKTNAITFSV